MLDAGTQAVSFCVVALLVSIALHFSSNNFPEPDGFYHFRHAAIYGSGGIFQAEFPWLPYSVVGQQSSDLGYGFHFLLIPFTWLEIWGGDPFLAMRVAGAVVTFAFLLFFYGTFRLLDIKPAYAWPFFLLFSSAFLLHRLAMLRSQPLSLGLSALLFAFIADRKHWHVFVTALASTFIHLNLFFVSLAVFGVFAAVKLLWEHVILWREGIALVAGILLGWFLRPNPSGAARMLYVQLVQHSLEKLGGNPLDFGAEHSPLILKLTSNYLVFLLLLLAALLYFLGVWLIKKDPIPAPDRTILVASSALTVLFFLLSIFHARRALDLCSAFGVIFMAAIFTRFLFDNRPVRILLVGAFLFLLAYGFSQRQQVLALGWDGRRFESGAKWMSDNSKPGDVVFNARWEYFPELFFWNTKNVYTSGLDPIFQYAYDSRRYRRVYSLMTGNKALRDCTGEGCDEPVLTDPYRVFKGDFNARFVFLAKPFDNRLYVKLLLDRQFLLRQESATYAIFEVN